MYGTSVPVHTLTQQYAVDTVSHSTIQYRSPYPVRVVAVDAQCRKLGKGVTRDPRVEEDAGAMCLVDDWHRDVLLQAKNLVPGRMGLVWDWEGGVTGEKVPELELGIMG
jgi:hypothetical protein